MYDCPVTHWYYTNEWTHNLLFNCFQIFYVPFYLQASGDASLALPFMCITGLALLARLRCLYLVMKLQFVRVYQDEMQEVRAKEAMNCTNGIDDTKKGTNGMDDTKNGKGLW